MLKSTPTICLALLLSSILSACGPDDGSSGSNNGSQPNSPGPSGGQAPVPTTSDTPDIDSEQTSFFFSYDESASTASRDLALAALADGRRPDPTLGRPFEFLNAEDIATVSGTPAGPFRVSMGLLRSVNGDIPISMEPEGTVYGLGVGITGPTLSLEERRSVVLTVLLDLSGSMDSPYANETASDVRSLLDVAKVGLDSMQESLKSGDVINLITFSSGADVLLEAHSPTANSLDNTIDGLVASGTTDINTGLNLAYAVANRTYDAEKANRVVIITDARVNTGVIDPNQIAGQTIINELEGIHFSGVGVGSSFNDRVLNTLTDVGKGSYSAMITPADATRIFTDGFTRFLEPAVRDVRFQLTYPQEMDQLMTFAEEISTDETEVQTINFSYNNSQYFLELFSGPSMLSTEGEIRLDITYRDDDDEMRSASVSSGVDGILGQNAVEIKAAAAVATLAQLINGGISCTTVLASNLYNEPVQNDVYASYRQHIDRFCSL